MKNVKTVLLGLLLVVAGSAYGSKSPDDKYLQPRQLIQVSNDMVKMTYDQTSAEIFVSSKSDFELYCRSPWAKATIEGNVIKVTATENDDFVSRTARITLTTKKENISRVITLTQAPEPGHDTYFALPKEGRIYPMTSMDLSKATHHSYIKEVLKNRSIDGHEVKIKNNRYETSVCTHASGSFRVQLNGAMRFVSDMGIDDDILSRDTSTHGDATYSVLLDGKEVAKGRITILDKKAVHLDINTQGAKVMEIKLDTNGSSWGDHVSFGNPYFELTSDNPVLVD